MALALLYCGLALVVTIRIALVTPAFQVADEPEHFLRAAQVGHGGLIAVHPVNGVIGGTAPASVDRLRQTLLPLRFQRHASGTSRMTCAMASSRWNTADVPTSFANTAIYPAFFYLPEALAIDAGRVTGLRLVPTIRLARLANALTATILATAAILEAGAAAPLLAVLLSLPMTLSLFGSCSQDALLIAACAWLAVQSGRGSNSLRRWALVAVGLGAVAAARPPYLAFSALPLLLAASAAQRRYAILATGIAVLIAAGWIAIGTAGLMTPTRGGGSVFSGGQAGFVLAHPWIATLILVRAPWVQFSRLGQEFIGVLGWLDVPLPGRVYGLALATLVAGWVLSGRFRREGSGRQALRSAAVVGVLFAAMLLIFLLQYLSWTPVGATGIEGVQGRYFIPVAVMATSLAVARPASAVRLRIATLVLAPLLLVDAIVVPHVVAAHYSMPPCG